MSRKSKRILLTLASAAVGAACKINQNTKYVLVVTKERIRHERRNQRLD